MAMLAAAFPLLAIASQAGSGIPLTILWILMLVIGFGLVVLEIYLPGFGVPGITGTLLLVGGILLCVRDSLPLALALLVTIVLLLCIVLSLSIRSASRGRLQKSRLVLHESEAPAVSHQDLSYYVGHEGVAVTVLRPAGIGEFDGIKLSVLSVGDFIAEGERIIIRRVEGANIIVDRAA